MGSRKENPVRYRLRERKNDSMRRNVTLDEISDGKLYGPNDMVKADCQDCRGCCDCCRGMGDSVILDPYDVWRLGRGLNKSMDELLVKELELGVADGNILPHLAMTGDEERCVFLNGEGRCSVHEIRPGFCRLFPLGRYYQENGFSYILQIHECSNRNRTKVKVKKWIDTPDLKRYEKFVYDWHEFLLKVQEIFYRAEDETLEKNLNLYVLNQFYRKPYEENRNFYEQFYERLKEAEGILSLEL